MPLTNAEIQKNHRARQQEKLARVAALEDAIHERSRRLTSLEAGLRSILAELDGNDKPLAVKLRAIAEEALK